MPLFISFEGPDGSGKSTQTRLLAAALRKRGLPVTETREPGGTPLGESVRELLLSPSAPEATPLAMALLLSSARAQLVSQVIKPSLRRGDIVIADRYADSTTAYQCYGLGLDMNVVRQLRRLATGGLSPEVVVYVDVPPDVGLRRVSARGGRNRLDRREVGFHARVRSGYQEIMREQPGRWIAVDGTRPEGEVHQRIMEELQPFLAKVVDAV